MEIASNLNAVFLEYCTRTLYCAEGLELKRGDVDAEVRFLLQIIYKDVWAGFA